jgi:hypothetical protein
MKSNAIESNRKRLIGRAGGRAGSDWINVLWRERGRKREREGERERERERVDRKKDEFDFSFMDMQ